jgi:adenine/guanine/hypoxanthine permease
MIERLFKLSENKTTVRTEVLAGVTTFLTMAYIIFVQPAVLSGKMFGTDTGIDFGAVTTNVSLGCISHGNHGDLRALSHRSGAGDG